MLEMLQYDFMVRALAAGAIVGIICPAIGVFLVLRRYSFMADTLAHVSLAGVALGLYLGVNPFAVTVGTALTAALSIERMRENQKLPGEAILALVMSAGLALAVVLISLSQGFGVDLMGYLFGSILTVGPRDVWGILLLGLLVLLVLFFLFKEFFLMAFDEDYARVSGLPYDKLNLVFIILTALTVAISLRIVGGLLVGALMVIPVLTSLLVSRSFKQVFFLSMFLGISEILTGLVVSYYWNLPSGGAVVLTALAVFFAAYSSGKLRSIFLKKTPAAPNTEKIEPA
ncbi:ABC-3 protein [Desulfofarcimen acetoxidans DSM 771]|uniref:ABC-3 protein n=1 Tax=Desulfofarcimen acetoxidans (strain ATCC 49208 / DSM 771 / KCTC 5769 / VKM B-1644 / 5575) TaxID=485916 RepID=C8VZA5_DESAS|nr:metal ABC transporter permease [Desulfofarcimen acetoxidans]ACV64850.1 ABC-3 protein [Desulfofarcimen acetoxidans DSM 771]